MHTSGEGKHRVNLEIQLIGEDILLILRGGEQSHLGGMVLYASEKQHTYSLNGHKDHIVLEPLASKAFQKYQRTVIAVGGIHIDNATKKDIDIIIQNCKELETCI